MRTCLSTQAAATPESGTSGGCVLLTAYQSLGATLYYLGEFASARMHLEQGFALYDSQQHRSHVVVYGQDFGVQCLQFGAWALWFLGYPEQALRRNHEVRILDEELSHPAIQVATMYGAARVRQLRREIPEVYELAEATITFSTEHGFAFYLSMVMFLRGWALSEQGQHEGGFEQMHQGLSAMRASGDEMLRPAFLLLLADAYGKRGQADEGFALLVEAWSIVEKSGQSYHNAEIHRLDGELQSPQSASDTPQAEACFQQGFDVARQQEAKSWKLRAASSLARL